MDSLCVTKLINKLQVRYLNQSAKKINCLNPGYTRYLATTTLKTCGLSYVTSKKVSHKCKQNTLTTNR